MIYMTSVTQKGQITIPVSFRIKYDVKPYEKVVVEDRGGELVVRKPKSFLDLGGSIKVPKHLRGLTDDDWDRMMAEAKRKEYAKKYGHIRH